MKDKIVEYLLELEQERNVKILIACETGSRAWQFPSPDSDFDVRIIYVHKSDWYLSINEKKDNIDSFFENNEIDISGWELKKSLSLLQKSNSALIERIQSPIIYMADEEFIADIQSAAAEQFSRIASIHHYLNMCKGMLTEINSDRDYKLKKFFYALRAACACKWIIKKEIMPPIEFTKIYPELNLDLAQKKRIDELIELKKTKSESYFHNGESELVALINRFVEEAEFVSKSLPAGRGNVESLNQILRKFIGKYDN